MSKNKEKRVTQDESSLELSRYYNESYFREETFDSMVFQLVEIYKLKPKRILEVGIGNGFVSNFLRKAGFDVTTVDINPNLNPDFVGGFDELSSFFDKEQFDLVLCAEVLEHLPFETFENNVKNLVEMSSKYLFVTIPRAHKTFLNLKFNITIRAKIFRIVKWRPWIYFSVPKKKISNLHHWEVDHSQQTKISKIKQILDKYAQKIQVGVIRRNHYHQYFLYKINK